MLTTLGTTTGTGTLRTDNTTANPIPSNINWAFTVLYNGTTQTVVPGNYSTLSIAGSGTKTMTSSITMNGVLNIASNNILDAQTYLIDGITSTAGTCILKTSNTSLTPLPENFTWTFTIEYSATTGNQYVVPGDYTSLIFSGSRGANNIYVANNETILLSGSLTATATFTSGAFVLTGNTIVYDGASQNVASFTYNNLSIEGTGDKTASGTININGNLHINSSRILLMSTRLLSSITTTSGTGTLRTVNTSSTPLPVNKTWNFTVDFNSTSSQTVVAGEYKNLILSGNRGANNITLTNTGIISINETFTPSVTFSSGNYITTNSTVNFSGGSQNIPTFTFNNLSLSGSDNKTMLGTVQVNGLLNLDNRSIVLNNNTLNIVGTISRTNTGIIAGTCNASSGNINISGSAGIIYRI